MSCWREHPHSSHDDCPGIPRVPLRTPPPPRIPPSDYMPLLPDVYVVNCVTGEITTPGWVAPT